MKRECRRGRGRRGKCPKIDTNSKRRNGNTKKPKKKESRTKRQVMWEKACHNFIHEIQVKMQICNLAAYQNVHTQS